MGIKGKKWFKKENSELTYRGNKVMDLSEQLVGDVLKSEIDLEHVANMSDEERRLIKNLHELMDETRKYTEEVNRTLDKINEIDYKLNQVLERMTKS